MHVSFARVNVVLKELCRCEKVMLKIMLSDIRENKITKLGMI